MNCVKYASGTNYNDIVTGSYLFDFAPGKLATDSFVDVSDSE